MSPTPRRTERISQVCRAPLSPFSHTSLQSCSIANTCSIACARLLFCLIVPIKTPLIRTKSPPPDPGPIIVPIIARPQCHPFFGHPPARSSGNASTHCILFIRRRHSSSIALNLHRTLDLASCPISRATRTPRWTSSMTTRTYV